MTKQQLAAVEQCRNMSPPWFTGRWRDWHRGHGCNLDDGKPRSDEAKAEIVAHGQDQLAAALERAGVVFQGE